jgi:5-hydroxyisourate hydrolase-like protein (transthyretin family)
MYDFMKTTLLNILLIALTIFTSCHDRKNIIVTGQIIDETTGKPITNAEVVVLCWYNRNIDDASFNKQTLSTDNQGRFQAKFEKGHQLDVASKAHGYQPIRSYNELIDNEIEVRLKLMRKEKNQTVVALPSTDNRMSDLIENLPFMRVRIPVVKNGQGLDFTNALTFGFDFKTLKKSSDTSQTDLWFKIENKEQQPSTIVTSVNGGLVPILENEIKSSLLFEKAIAPRAGYVRTYKLTGLEEGFFVRCRDGKTYGKIILKKSAIDTQSPDGKGSYYKEFGQNFSCLYQPNGTTDLTYSQTDINLEDFLLDF